MVRDLAVTSDISTNETGSAVYCAGCNGCFVRTHVGGSCPRCGAAVRSVPDVSLAESLLIREGRSAPIICNDDDLDRRIGSRLHLYQLESLIGRGGMGRVYLATHSDLQRRCALKILSPRLSAADSDYVTRFQHEGRAAAALNHSNIVTVHAIGHAEGLHFLEMEFVAGRSLQQLIMDEGRLPPARATALLAGVADGLAAAHRENILHRDLKPDNVLLTHRGVPKIGDFGLAKRIVLSSSDIREKLVGTPNFMAPELLSGQPASTASDVYALGVCYFVMLTGRFPFVRGSVSQLKDAVANDPLPNVREICSDVSLEMAEGLASLLEKSPENRPADGVAASELLHAILGQVRDIDSLLKEAFGDSPSVKWSRCDRRYQVELSLPEGRQQTLYVEESAHETSKRLLLFYSVCCPAKCEYYEHALRLNSDVAHGGLAIRDVGGEPMFVMVDTYPRATVDSEDIRKSVLEVAIRADAVEKLLTGKDRN